MPLGHYQSMTIPLITRGIVAGALVLAATACERTVEIDHRDTGRACISGEGDVRQIDIDFGLCRSSSCEVLLDSSCDVTVEGDTITITSLATIESPKGSATCTADCQSANADCETPPIAPGSYTVVYGELSDTIEIPADEELCLGDAGL